MGADDLDIDGKDVQEGGTPEKPGKDQSNFMHTGVNLVITGISGLQEASDKRRGFLLGEEENQNKLRGVRGRQ